MYAYMCMTELPSLPSPSPSRCFESLRVKPNLFQRNTHIILVSDYNHPQGSRRVTEMRAWFLGNDSSVYAIISSESFEKKILIY